MHAETPYFYFFIHTPVQFAYYLVRLLALSIIPSTAVPLPPSIYEICLLLLILLAQRSYNLEDVKWSFVVAFHDASLPARNQNQMRIKVLIRNGIIDHILEDYGDMDSDLASILLLICLITHIL